MFCGRLRLGTLPAHREVIGVVQGKRLWQLPAGPAASDAPVAGPLCPAALQLNPHTIDRAGALQVPVKVPGHCKYLSEFTHVVSLAPLQASCNIYWPGIDRRTVHLCYSQHRVSSCRSALGIAPLFGSSCAKAIQYVQ